MIAHRLMTGLALAAALLAGAGCGCFNKCRTSCCAPAPAAAPCCPDGPAGTVAPAPVQAFSPQPPYAGH